MLDFIVGVLAVYALFGVAVGVATVLFGLTRIDPVMRSSSLAARMLMLPGSVTLWPLMLTKWLSARKTTT